MLSRELMGLLALAILWVNTLLVAGAAFGRWRELRRRLGAMARDGVVEGTVAGDAPLAWHEIEQVGRKASDDADRQAILFHDRRFTSVVVGGRVATADGDVGIAAEHERAEVWIAAEAHARAAACASDAEFDAAYLKSQKPRGFERIVRCEVGPGDRVWIHAPCLVATFDPRPWCRRSTRLLLGFVAAVLLGAGAVTALALHPPLFGTVSTVGGALGLAYFLLVQPAGTAARDAVRVPCEAYLRGSWVKAGSEGRGGPAPAAGDDAPHDGATP